MTTATTAAFARREHLRLPDRLSASTPLVALGFATAISVYAVYVGGVLVAGAGSLTRCLSWPIRAILPADVPGFPQVARLADLIVAAILLIALVLAGLRQQSIGGVRRAAAIAAVAFPWKWLPA